MSGHEATTQLALDVAEHLEGWTMRPLDDETRTYPSRTLDGPDGREILVRFDWRHKDRATISYYLTPACQEVSSRDLTPWDKREISVKADRGAEVIAREITRRLFPKLDADLAEWRKRVAEHEAYEARKQTTEQIISEALGDAKGSGWRGNVIHYGHGRTEGYGEFTASADSVQISLRSIPVALAVQIAHVLRDAAK